MQDRLKKKNLNYMDRRMLFVVYFALSVVGANGANVCHHVCLHWKFNKTHLTLTCKVTDLKFTVSILSPTRIEQAFCFPPLNNTKCHANYKNGSMSENLEKGKVIFSTRGRIDDGLNGQWICKHGTHKHRASVEVTIPRSELPQIKMCWQEMSFYSFIGYMPTFIFIFGLIWTISYVGKNQDSEKFTEFRIADMIRRHISRRVNNGLQKVCFVILTVFIVCVPPVVGAFNEINCSGEIVFIFVGVLVGTISSLLLISILYRKKTDPDRPITFQRSGDGTTIYTLTPQADGDETNAHQIPSNRIEEPVSE